MDYDVIPDADLLRRFRRQHDGEAFAALVRRHGPLVMGVCQQILRQPHDAEDAFQATFVVLALRSRSIRQAGSLAGWLYKVAYRTAMRAVRQRQENRCEAVTGDVPVLQDPLRCIYEQSLRFAVHDELNALPCAYRDPIVLCYLEGLTRREAADALGCTDASIKARLARAKKLLRVRLVRRGMTLSIALTAAAGGVAMARESLAHEIIWKTVSVSTSAAWSGASDVVNVNSLITAGRRHMSISMTPKLAAVTAACGIMILGMTWMNSVATERKPAEPGALRTADALARPAAARAAELPVQMTAHEFGTVPLRWINVAADDPLAADSSDADELQHQQQYLEKKAQAYFMLRDVELERAKSAAEPLSRMEARAKAQIHEAEAEKLSREAKQLQPRLPNMSDAELLYGGEIASVPPAPCCRQNNLAYGRSVTASSQEEIISNFAQLAVDGDLSTRWCAEDDSSGEWIQVDLGAIRKVSRMRIHWEMMNTKYSYRIEASTDGSNWQKVVDTSQDPQRAHMPEHDLNVPEARYLRITFLRSDTGFWGSIREIEVSDGELSPAPREAWEKIRPDAEYPSFIDLHSYLRL